MGKIATLVAVLVVMLAPAGRGRATELPPWAYPVNPPGSAPAPNDGAAKHVPHSSIAFTRQEIAAIATQVPDWHPGEHPAMPGIVARGRAPLVYACGYCHLPNGSGRPENASLAGLTASYIKQQMIAFGHGDRLGAEPNRLPHTLMVALAKSATEAEIADAAGYFAALKPASFIKVVEAATVPKTIVAGWTLTAAPGGGFEPIGNRVIEMPEDFERFENRDSRTAYVAYVPPGSIGRGAELIATGAAGRSVQCVTCHGPELRGLGDVPRIVGRSPGYLFRQLYDFRQGLRRGGTAELMKPVVANLTDEDLVAIVAYLASRAP